MKEKPTSADEKLKSESVYNQAITGVKVFLYLRSKTNSLGLNTGDIDNLLRNLGNNPIFYESRKILYSTKGNNLLTLNNMEKMTAIVSQDIFRVLRFYDELLEFFKSRTKECREDFYAIKQQQ